LSTVSFVHDQRQVRIVFGPGRLTSLPDELDRLGLRRVLLVATRYAARATEALADRVVATVTDPRPHVPTNQVATARTTGTAARIDGLVAIGGGSAIGLAKAVALETGLPIVAVPTTYSGSEMTRMWGRTTGGRKETGRDVRVGPKLVIYDPDLLGTLPAATAAASALNALAHAVEALYAPDRTVFSDLAATAAVREIVGALYDVTPDPTRLLRGASLAGSSLDVTTMGLHHKLCHVLGGSLDLPHAQTHSAILPHVLGFNLGAVSVADRFEELGGTALPSRLQELARAFGVPGSLRALGMRRTAIDGVVDAVLRAPPANPMQLSKDTLRGVLERAWAGGPA
jgi:maleylacetate reductase